MAAALSVVRRSHRSPTRVAAPTAADPDAEVKVVRPYIADEHFRARFRREVEAARQAGGFWTAPVIDVGPDAVTPWVASRYMPAPHRGSLVTRDGALADAAWGPGRPRRVSFFGGRCGEKLSGSGVAKRRWRGAAVAELAVAEWRPRWDVTSGAAVPAIGQCSQLSAANCAEQGSRAAAPSDAIWPCHGWDRSEWRRVEQPRGRGGSR